MTTIFPGAIWRPIPVSSSRPKRGKGRAVIFHVAVSESASLFPLFSTSGNDSHLYVRKDGTAEQYIDLDLVAYASLAANANTISVETQGGVTNADAEPWTAAQVATLAAIARWAHDTEGVPLSLMPNSLPTSKGIGFHRLGVDPWRVAGGEVWSSSRGKLCPGAAKIAQVPQIIQLAVNGDDMFSDTDRIWLEDILRRIQSIHYNGFKPLPDPSKTPPPDWRQGGDLSWLDQRQVDIETRTVNGVKALLAAQPSPVDPQTLAEAVVTAMGTEFAQKVIDALGQRITATQG